MMEKIEKMQELINKIKPAQRRYKHIKDLLHDLENEPDNIRVTELTLIHNNVRRDFSIPRDHLLLNDRVYM